MTLSYQHIFEPETNPSTLPLLLLHGTGGDEHDLLDLGRQLASGSFPLSPRGDLLEQGAPCFFRRFSEGVFDLDDVRTRTHALAGYITEAGHGLTRADITAAQVFLSHQ